MGFRTVVMLSNDHAHEWENDTGLGTKISRAMHHVNRATINQGAQLGSYGQVVQCVHADTQTLAVMDGYTTYRELAGKSWVRDEQDDDVALRLLKDAANKLGYRLVKKPGR